MNAEPKIFRADTNAIWLFIGPGGADVRLKLEGLGSLARDLAAPAELARAAA
jgi:hypothetical protein